MCEYVDTANVDKLDLLFVIDETEAMSSPQDLLRVQFPRLVATLTIGQRYPGDPNPFPPFKSIHLGVVSSDMGLAGVGSVIGCDAMGGDDGQFRHEPLGDGCDAAYPNFLSFESQAGPDRAKLSMDFACISALGTAGCAVRQPLEAALKALWPSVYVDAGGNVVDPNPLTFLSVTEQGALGRGDLPIAQGGNAGFLRLDPWTGISQLAIVVLSDGDDCSVRSPEELGSDSEDDYALRCSEHPEALYNIADRFVRGLTLLRPGYEDLVLFAGIVGVPPDLVDPEARLRADFSQPGAYARFYDRILDDPRMQFARDPENSARLRPCCASGERRARPARRIVELAKAFPEHSLIQSICQDDLAPAIDPLIDALAQATGSRCLSQQLRRSGSLGPLGSSGKVDCDVIWQLPAPGAAPASTPTHCSDLPFLKRVARDRANNDRGGENCLVDQIAVQTTQDGTGLEPASGDGWYYDDFDTTRVCRRDASQRIAFTALAKPPPGVISVLDCAPSALAR